MVHQAQQQGQVCLRTVRVLPAPLERAFGQAKGRAVVSDDCPRMAERFHHGMPGEQAGPEAVQQNEDRLSLPDHLVMDIEAVDLDEMAVRVGQLLRWYRPRGRGNRDEERPDQQDQQQDKQAEAKATQAAPSSHFKLAAF